MTRISQLVRHSSRKARVLALALAASTLLAACSSGTTGATPSGSPDPSGTPGAYPSYYPASYSQIIAASKKESGTLTIYSNADQKNVVPIIDGFRTKYPWVKNVLANNLDSDVIFQRQISEMATGSAPADMMISNSAQAWADYIGKGNKVLSYTSPEAAKLPKEGQVMPGVYSMSLDAIGFAYNTALVPEAPKSYAALVKLVQSDPARFKGKISTRDVAGTFGFTVSRAYAQGNAKSWGVLQKLLPMARPETSSGTQLEKVTSGEYLVSMFLSSAVAYPAQDSSGGLVQYVLPTDGTVVLGRGIGITPKAPNPATAKLFLDYVLSQAGQDNVAEGGLSSYRPGIPLTGGRHTYQEIQKNVPASGIYQTPYTLVSPADVTAFKTRWNGLLGK